MRQRMISRDLIAGLLLLSFSALPQARELEPINPKAGHVERWNWFARAVYALHEKQIKGRKITTTITIGGYKRNPDFYKEIRYKDANTDRLVSIIQWERKHPKRIHWIETYVYDDRGRLSRDFSAAFLTTSRHAPQQTIINLYSYNGKLRAFRQFDATDNRIYESCAGSYKGKVVDISLWEIDILNMEGEPDAIMTTPAYIACFKDLPIQSAGKYLTPQ